MAENKHIIIYSHGFGVRKDGRGLLTDIADSLKNTEAVLFDYNEVDEEKNQLTVKPFSAQAEILKENINKAKANNPDGVIDIISHSQGAIIVALAQPAGIRKTIFIAPPSSLDTTRMMNLFKSRPGTEINMQGISKLSRQDGSTTIIPPEYWAERETTNPMELYRQFSKMTELTIITANQDETVGKSDFSSLDNVKIINIDGDHNFSGDSRKGLLEEIGKVI